MAVSLTQKLHDRVFPFRRALAKEQTGQNRRENHGIEQRAKQGECYGPRHGFEEPPLDRLEREYGQVRGNDDADWIEDRTLDLMRSLGDPHLNRSAIVFLMRKVANDVFHHDHCSLDYHPEIQRA